MCDQLAADVLLFVFYLSHGLVWVCEIEKKTMEIPIWCVRIYYILFIIKSSLLVYYISVKPPCEFNIFFVF